MNALIKYCLLVTIFSGQFAFTQNNSYPCNGGDPCGNRIGKSCTGGANRVYTCCNHLGSDEATWDLASFGGATVKCCDPNQPVPYSFGGIGSFGGAQGGACGPGNAKVDPVNQIVACNLPGDKVQSYLMEASCVPILLNAKSLCGPDQFSFVKKIFHGISSAGVPMYTYQQGCFCNNGTEIAPGTGACGSICPINEIFLADTSPMIHLKDVNQPEKGLAGSCQLACENPSDTWDMVNGVKFCHPPCPPVIPSQNGGLTQTYKWFPQAPNDPNIGQCRLPCQTPGAAQDPMTGQCNCTPQAPYNNGTACVPCTGGAWTADANGNGYCACPAGQFFNGTSCQCPSGQTWNGSSCACPSGLVWSGYQCACPQGSSPLNSATPPFCQCNTGTVWNGTICAPVPPPAPSPVPNLCTQGKYPCSAAGGQCMTRHACRDYE